MKRGVLIAGAALTMLVGCASAKQAPPADFSAAELDQYHEFYADAYWDALGYPDELRPQVDSYEVVSVEAWWPLFQECLDAAGFPGYPDPAINYEELNSIEYQRLDISAYRCQLETIADPLSSGYLTPPQADYAYDYYQQTLVPCLALQKISVTDVPSRSEFIEGFGGWNPYWSVDLNFGERDDRELLATCPPIAPGLPDLGFYG